MRVLFVMRSLDAYLRFFAAPLEELADRGHEVRLLLEDADHAPADQEWLDAFAARPNVTVDVEEHFRRDPWFGPAVAVRQSLNYVRVLGPRYAGHPIYEKRSGDRAPAAIRTLTRLPLMRSAPAQSLLWRALSAVDRAMPLPEAAARYVARVAPDVVAVCDYGRPGSLHSSYVRAARRLGIPSAICVASWDNLSTRQMLRAVPDVLTVWNDEQVREAVELHAIPRDRVVVTGAQNFDHWFDWEPRPAEEFKRLAGLDPDRPYLLWVGGALFPAAISEQELVARWLDALRASGLPRLAGLGVLVRPHPLRVAEWLAYDFSRFDAVSVWPRELSMPVSRGQRADYFDSIFHSAAVVGVNTSAMIEAAIVDRPVLSVVLPEFRDSQLGTFHFGYITEDGGGPVRLAHSLAEHLRQLEEALEGVDEASARNRRFVERFVRPGGRDRPAVGLFVGALEGLAGAPVPSEAEPAWALPLRGAVAVVTRTQRAALRARRRLASARGRI